jgi:hypothetical protein
MVSEYALRVCPPKTRLKKLAENQGIILPERVSGIQDEVPTIISIQKANSSLDTPK